MELRFGLMSSTCYVRGETWNNKTKSKDMCKYKSVSDHVKIINNTRKNTFQTAGFSIQMDLAIHLWPICVSNINNRTIHHKALATCKEFRYRDTYDQLWVSVFETMKYLPTCYKKDGNSLLLLTLVLYTYIYSAFLKQRRKLIDTENWRRTMRSPMLRHVGCIDDVMQKGIIDTKMREKGRLSCARCSASFPTVAIIKCDNTILGKWIYVKMNELVTFLK